MSAVSPLTGWGLPEDDEQLLPLNIRSNAYELARIVKSGPGRCYGFTVYSSKASAQFIQWFDANTVPGAGSAPDGVIGVAAASSQGVAWLPPRIFHTGFVLVCSTTAPTYTAGSADCYFDVQFV